MGRKRKEVVEVAVEHITTTHNIKSSNTCSNCPYRIYCDDNEKVELGVGNIYSNMMFILPSYDTKAKIGYNTILSLLSEIYKEVTGNDLFENAYITRLVKCNKNSEHDLYTSSVDYCRIYLKYEFVKLRPNKVVFFGDTYDLFTKGNGISNIVDITTNHRAKVEKAYNPAVLYYDNEELKDKLINRLKEILL